MAAIYLFDQLDRQLTERQIRLHHSNARLQAILDNVVDGIITLDQEGNIQSLNQAAQQMFDHEPTQILGRNLKLLLGDTFSGISSGILSYFLGGDLSTQIGCYRETVGRRQNGTTFPMELVFSEMKLDNRRLFIAILRDITDRKSAEAALQRKATELAQLSTILAQTNTILEKRNQELDQFAYIVSHDLKAPLRAIANLSSWIEEDIQHQLNEETRHQMDLLRGRVHRMENLIEGILQYSRVGRVKTSQEQVNVETLLAEVIDSLAPPSAFTITVTKPMPILETERLPLEQVFANLIGNAIKHHNRLDGRITVSFQDKAAFWEFTVADDGPGIAPQYHEKIFAIFQTLESQHKVDSTGIGLSLVKKIVESQGGTLDLESQVGQGATFRFTWLKRNSQSSSLVSCGNGD